MVNSLIDKFTNLSPTYLIGEMFTNFSIYNSYTNEFSQIAIVADRYGRYGEYEVSLIKN
nr:hypothetical protein [Clostridioides sp.]